MIVNIAPDFRDLWPEHTPEELDQLTENCLADPDHERMPPIAVWVNAPKPNTILDGHHQYVIRSKKRLKIKYAKLKFDMRQDALAYAIQAQLGRRNLDESRRALAVAEMTKSRKPVGGVGADSANLRDRNSMAQAAGVSKRTMDNAVRVAEKAADEVKDAVRDGEFAVSDGAAIADLPKDQQKKIVTKAKRKNTTLKAAKQESTAEPEAVPREWGEGSSLSDVQADLEEAVRRVRDAVRLLRKVFACEDKQITRPYCGQFSMMLLGELSAVAQTIKNEMPVGGTPKKPKLFREQKVEELAG